MIDLSEVVNNPDMAQDFTLLRSSGSWQNGIWISVPASQLCHGVVSVATPRDLDMIPEGDRVTGAMVFHSSVPLYGTWVDPQGMQHSSDILMWNGNQFRVLTVSQYLDYGYYRAVATRLLTD